jgi:hypothetical protein
MFLVAPSGGISTQPVTSNASADGWIDATHVVVDTSLYTTNSSTPVLSILNVNTGALARIQASGSFVAALPGNL